MITTAVQMKRAGELLQTDKDYTDEELVLCLKSLALVIPFMEGWQQSRTSIQILKMIRDRCETWQESRREHVR